jgi:N12 class adenine-specific DNA methylase
MPPKPLAPFDLPEEDDQPDQQPQAQAEPVDQQDDQQDGGDVLDTLAPRRQIDTSRGDPRAFTGDMRKWFASEVQDAERAQAHNDVLDRMTAKQGQREAAAAQAKQERQAAAQVKQGKKDANSKLEADFRTRGVQMYTDANGDIQPILDEKGGMRFHAQKGEDQWDEKGQAFREDRSESGAKTKVMLDADAPLGHGENDLANIYRQNKHSAWEPVATVQEGLKSSDPAIKEAAMKANDAAQKHQHAAAKQALAMEENEISAKENAANIEFQGRAQQAAKLQQQVDQLRANPAYNQTEGGAVFGIGKKPAPAAQDLRDQEKQLNAQIGDLTANPPDPKVFAQQRHAATTRAHAFDYLLASQGSMEGALGKWGEDLTKQGQDPTADPVIQSVNKARARAGLAPIAGTVAPAPTADEQPAAEVPPEMQASQQARNEIKAVFDDIQARFAPVKQKIADSDAQIAAAQAQAGEHAKTLKALGIGPDNNNVLPGLWERSAVPRAGLEAAQARLQSLSEERNATVAEHNALVAEHTALIGDEKNPGELLKAVQAADATAMDFLKNKEAEFEQAKTKQELGLLAGKYFEQRDAKQKSADRFGKRGAGDEKAIQETAAIEAEQRKTWKALNDRPDVQEMIAKISEEHPDWDEKEQNSELYRQLKDAADIGPEGRTTRLHAISKAVMDGEMSDQEADAEMKSLGANQTSAAIKAQVAKSRTDFEAANKAFTELAKKAPFDAPSEGGSKEEWAKYEAKQDGYAKAMLANGIDPDLIEAARNSANANKYLRKVTLWDEIKHTAKNLEERLPWVGQAAELAKVGRAYIAAQNLELGKATDDDLAILKDFVGRSSQEKAFLAKAFDIVAESPAFMVELANVEAGSVAFRVGTQKTIGAISKRIIGRLATEGGAKFLERQIERNVVTRIIGKTITKGAAKAVETVAGVPMSRGVSILAGQIERMMPEVQLSQTDKGTMEVILNHEGRGQSGRSNQGVGEAFWNSALDQYVEVFSEKAGGAGGLWTREIAATKLGQKIAASAVVSALVKLNPLRKSDLLKSFAKKANFHGTMSEMAEERLGEFMRGGMLHLDGQDYKAPTMEQIALELVAFSAMGPMMSGAAKVGQTAKNIYNDKATVQGAADNVQESRALGPDMLEALGAISEPSPDAIGLGAKPLAEQKTAIGEADAKIEGLRSELESATGILNVNKRAEIAQQIEQAVKERQGIVQKSRAFEEATAEIDSIGKGTHPAFVDATPEQAESTMAAARALIKISQGAEMDSLTALERSAVEHSDSPDGLPRVEMVKGGDGEMHPVITDGAIKRLAAVAPAAASLIGKGERARRAEVLAKTDEPAKPAEPAQTPEAGEAAPAAGEVEPMRPLSEDEEKRTRAFRRILTNQGVTDELADRVARGYVSKHGMKGAPADHKDGLTKALAAAGGHTFTSEPDAMKRKAANTAALAGTAATDARVSGPLHEQRANQLADTFAEALSKVGWAIDKKTGKVVFGKEHATGLADHDRTAAMPAIRNLATGLAKYFHNMPIAVQVGAARGSEVQAGQPSSGGAWMTPKTQGGGITISIHDVLTRTNLADLANPERAQMVIQEEAIHTLADNLLGHDAVAELFAKVKKEAPAFAELVARSYGTRNDYILGHELIRYRAQWILQGKVNEQTSPDVLESDAHDAGGKVVGLVRVFLGKLLAAIKNFVSALKKQGASEETVNAIEKVAQAVAKKIRENAADARRLDPYGVAYDARGATNADAEEAAGAENPTGGGGVGASQRGGAVQPGGNAATSGNQQGGGAVQKGAGVGGVPGHDADASATRKELAAVRAELDAKKEAEEAARGRRNAAIAHVANRLADFQEVLAKVPADKRAEAEALLNRAIMGAATYVVGVNHTRFPAAYMAAAPGLVQTSHLPDQQFAKNPAYGGSNTRKYESDEAEQNKVRGIALPGALDAGSVANTAKSASEGAPQIALVIGKDGNVTLQTAGGNGREMGFNLAGTEDQNILADEWKARAADFGFKNLPDGFRGYRFLGVYDLRSAAESKSYQSLVDALNPSPGVVAGAGQRAEIDARTKIDPAALSGLSIDISTSQAVEKLTEFLRNAEKLGLDRNLMTAIASDPANAQLYIQKLILAGAFHTPAISQFYFDSASVSGGVTAKGLVKAAAQAAIELRTKGADGAEFADAIAGTLAEVISYTKQGQSIASAIGNAAQQAQTGAEGELVQLIASTLEKKVEFREQNKSGTRPVNTEATIENFNELFEDIARAVGNFSAEPDLLGETDTLDATLARALAANARRTQEYQATPAVASQAPRSDSTRRDTRRLRDLLNQQREEGLNRWEQAELETLEKKAGQNFMRFYDETKTQPKFTLEQQETGDRPAQAEQMALLSRTAKNTLSEEAAQQYLDFHNVPIEKQAEGKKAIAQARKASKKPYSLPTGRGLDRDGQQRARERQAEAYRGLKENKPELLKKAFQEGIPVSSLLADFVNREIPSFDIRGAVIENAADFAAFALPHRSPVFESVKVAVLDNRSQVIHSQIVHVGSLNETLFGVREILSVVNTAKARNPKIPIQGFVISHNHPSGETKPSNADTRATTILEQAADSIGVPMIDHIITNGKNYFSYRESGIMAGRSGKTLPGKLRQPQREKPAADLAEWQAIPNEARVVLAGGRDVQTVADTLKTADPDHVHAIFCDTQSRVLSVNRYPIDQRGLHNFQVGPVAQDAASATAHFVFLSLPKKVGVSRVDAKAFLTRAALQFKQLNVTLHDAQLPDGQLAREVNLMEDPATFQNDMAEQSRFFTKKATEAGLQSADAADLRQWTKWAEEWRAANPRQEAATPAVASRTGNVEAAVLSEVEKRRAAFATHKPEFDRKLRAVSAALPDATPIVAPIKGSKRAVEKLMAKRQKLAIIAMSEGPVAAEMMKPENLAATLGDILRGSIIVDTIDQRVQALRELAKTFGEENVRVKDDRFASPTPAGYSDIQIEIDVAPGMKAELQIHIPEMLAAKEGNEVKKMGVPERYWPENLNIRGLDPEQPGHSFYEIERDVNAPEQERARATERMAELYADARAAYERRTQAKLAISARNAASSTLFAPSISEGKNRIAPLPAGPQTNGLPSSTTTGSPSSSFQNLAPGLNFSGSFIDPSIQPGGESDNGKPAITAQNVKEFTGTLAVSPNALPESGMWNVFDRTKFDAAEGAEVVPVSQLISRKDERQDPKYKAGTKGFPVANAYKFMLQSQQGRSEKGGREPLTVTRNADGTFEILDGNSTAQVLMLAGWKSVPVSVQGETQSAGTLDQILEREDGTIEAQLSPASRTAFHGTPHSFDRFTLEKVGTGEGAQVYGWGLYFAENKAVAQEYKTQLGSRLSGEKRDLKAADPLSLTDAKNLLANGESVWWTREDMPVWTLLLQPDKISEEDVQAVGVKFTSELRPNGNIYTVSLDVEPEDLLDWDKPLSEQSEKVRNLLHRHWLAHKDDHAKQTGREIYAKTMTQASLRPLVPESVHDHFERQASEYMAKIGIPGIRYLDQGSRGGDTMLKAAERNLQSWERELPEAERRFAETKDMPQYQRLEMIRGQIKSAKYAVEDAQRKLTEGTYNFVIFDDSKIRITHRNGDPIEQTPMARAPRFDPNQIDIFGGNTLTAPPAPSKGAATNENKPAKSRRNNDPLGIGNGELLLPGLHSDSQGSGAPTGVDPEQFDLFAGGNATARPGRPGSGGAGGDVIGGGSAGDGTLAATEAGAAGSDREGVSGDVRDNGNAAGEPAKLERPPEGSPDRNARIDPGRSYAPKQGRARFDANITAIQLMRKLEAEGRNATTAEKETLLTYTGWGWLKGAFNAVNAAKWKQNEEQIRGFYTAAKERHAKYLANTYRNHYATDPGTWEEYLEQSLENQSGDEDKKKLAGWAKNYLEDYTRLRQELTPEEFDSAAKSVRNAHFTDIPVIAQMWALVRRLGFKGGRVTEPGGGIGHFIGTQPDDLADRSVWNAVELDDITARILSHLYPEANVNGEPTAPGRTVTGQGWQEARIPNHSQDLVISNVPFAKEGPGTSGKEFGTAFNLHNYFFARAFAKAKPGGLVVFITSNSTMDNNLDQRQALAGMADLVGAIRLPNNAFKANAGTEVTTDILVFRKPDGLKPNFEPKPWMFTREVARMPIVSNKKEDETTLDWLRGIKPGWIPQNQAIATLFNEWVSAGTPKTGQRAEPLEQAVRDSDESQSMTFIAPVEANEYWLANPEHALGKHALVGKMYGPGEYTLTPGDGSLVDAMERAIQTFPADIAGSNGTTNGEPERLTAGRGDKMGSYVERGGKIYRVDPDGLTEPEWSKTAKKAEMFRSWSKIRTAYNTLIDLELHNGTEDDIESARATLNRAYDRHIRGYDYLAKVSRNPMNYIGDDPDFIPMQALEIVAEDVRPDGKIDYHYSKADIFSKRLLHANETPKSADTLEDAVLISMSKNGFLHVPTVAELRGVTEPVATQQLIEANLGFIDPQSGLLESADSYLSGNVAKKLEAAVEAAKTDPKYRPNVDALTDAQPQWQPIAGIHPNLRANWVPAEVVEAFAVNAMKLHGVTVEKSAGMTALHGTTTADTPDKFGTDRKSASTLLKEILGHETTVVKDRVPKADGSKGTDTVINTEATNAAKAARAEIEAAFSEYVKIADAKVTVNGQEMAVPEAAERSFNRSVGGWVPPTYRGDWITLPGQSGEIYLDRGFRKAVLARMLTLGYGMIAHGVGSGKTLTQVALAMELRRLGKARKPVIVVEKSTIGQFASAFRRAYPQAKLLVAGDRNFGKDDRARFLGMMQAGDWDAIIMTRPQVTKIPHEDAAFNDYISRRLADLDRALIAATDTKTQNNIQSIRDALQEQIAKMQDKLRSNMDAGGVPWERLGVDALIVDEAHNFKNTFVFTQMENVKNLPTGTSSQQSISMELKTSHVRNRMGNKGIFFATGTPVSNAMHEAWVMMNYIAPHVLEENGVGTFDQFADTYGDTKTGPEANWNGDVKDVTRFAKFVNGKSLINLIRSVFDVAMGNAKLGLDVPAIKGGESQRKILDVTPPMKRVNDWVVNNIAETWKNTFGEKDENGAYIVRPMQGLRDYIDANPWVTAVPIMTMQSGIAAALDPRMLHDNAPDDPGSKVNQAVKMILDRYRDEENQAKKTTQVVFTDLRRSFNTTFLEQFTGVNPFEDLGANASSFDLYEDIAKKLVAGGVPRNQIGWLPSGKAEGTFNDDQKEAFLEKVNSGEIRVLIGGEGISTGVNIQERLGTAYHLMPPRNFKPAQMEQRNGRIIRQGNLWAEWGHNAFVNAVEKATGQKFENKRAEKRRKAASEWLEKNDPTGEILKAAQSAASRYAIEIFEFAMGRSLDSAIYSMMAAKQGFIAQYLSGNAGDEFEDPTDGVMLSMATIAAETIGDPDLIRKIEAERELKDLRVKRSAWIGKQSEHSTTIRNYTDTLPSMRARLAQMQESSNFYEGLFDRRKDEEGKAQAPLYEFSTGTKFDPEDKEQKKAEGGITNVMNKFFMETWANRKGSNSVIANGSVKINGVKFDVEIHEPLPGDDRGMPGAIVGRRGSMPFHGAQSFNAIIRNSIAELPKVTEGMRQNVKNAEQRIERARKALSELPKSFEGEQRFNMLTEEIKALRSRITARKRGGAEEFINIEDITRWETEGGGVVASRTVAARAGTPGSIGELVTNNLPLAYGIADRFDNTAGSDKEERRSIARQALVKAARAYDATKGEFAAYAGTSVRNAMRDHFHRQGDYAHRNLTTLDAPMEEGGEDTFKDAIPSTGPTAASDAQIEEMKRAVRAAIEELPQGLREVVEGIAAGDTFETIGQRQGGLTKQGIARKAQVAMERMRHALKRAGVSRVDDILSPASRAPGNVQRTAEPSGGFEEEVKMFVKFARAEAPGERTTGRPDLALGTLDPIIMGVDEARKKYQNPETHDQWQAAADALLAKDYDGMKRRMIDAAGRGFSLTDPTEVKAAMMIVAKEVKRAAENQDDAALQRDVHLLVNSYRDARAEQARGLAGGRDPFKTPAERYREFLAKVIYQVPADVQKKLDDAKTPAERKQILSEDEKRIARIKAALENMGITLEDIFSGEVELRLKARKTAENELNAIKGKDADILKMFMERRNFAAVAAEMKVPEKDVRRVVEEAKQRVINRHAAKFQKGATAANVVAAKAPGWQAEMDHFLDAIGLTEETPAQQKKRVRKAKAKGRPFDITDPVSVVRIARTIQALDSGALNMALELWMNNILSGPATHVANIAGNALNMAWDMSIQRGTEAMMNTVFRDKKSAQLGEAKYLLRGIMPGIQRARQLATMAWTAEYDFTEHVLLGKPVDLQEISGKVAGSTAIRGPVGRVVRVPGRALLYADSFFKGLIATMEVGAQAYRTAKAEGLSGAGLEARIKDQIDTYGSPAWIAAVEKAKELTFQQDLREWGSGEDQTHNPMEAMAAAVQRASISCPPLRFIVPFIRTPFNIMRAGIRKTPLGSLPLAWDVLSYAAGTGRNWIAKITGGEVKANPKMPADFVRKFSEQLIGWSIMAMVWGMAQGDDDDDEKQILITGSSPKKEVKWGEKELQTRAYGGDYVIRIGGRGGSTFSYGRYEPFATVLGTVVDAARVLKRPSTSEDKLDAFFNYAVAQGQDKTFLRGISEMFQTVSNGKSIGSKAANAVAQALVPNIIRQPLRNLDDYVRDSRGAGFDYAMFPAAENAQKKHDVYGEDVKKSGSPLARLLVTTPTETAEKLHPADELLLRWNRQHPEETFAPQPPPRTYRDHATKKDVKMTDAQYSDYTALVGTKVKANLAGKVTARMIASPTVKDKDMVRDAFEKARHDAREQMFNKRSLADLIWK